MPASPRSAGPAGADPGDIPVRTIFGSEPGATATRARSEIAILVIVAALHLAKENLPAGTRLAMGSAIIEVTAVPHLGGKKFTTRFGLEAMKFVNSRRGKKLCLRGINAKVVESGRVSAGDTIRRV